MDSSSGTGGPTQENTRESKLDVPFVVGMVCCAIGALLLIFGIIRLIMYFVLSSKDKTTSKQSMKQIQHNKYLRDYEQKAAPSINGYVFTHPGQTNGSVRSWTGGSNVNRAFEWSDAGTNHSYVNDGTLVKVSNGLENNTAVQRHNNMGNGSLHGGGSGSGFEPLPERDYIDCVIVDDESMLPSSQRYADVVF